MACNRELTLDMLFDCADAPRKGIDGDRAIIINYDDIDFSQSTVSGSKVTLLKLKSGKSGKILQWYKELASANSSYSPSTEDVDGFLHNFQGRLATTTAEHAERSNELKQGRFIVVFETRYKGVNSEDAFKVLGWNCGLRLTELTQNTNENSGSILFTVGTEEGDFETYPYNIFLETDYATSKASFDTAFVSA